MGEITPLFARQPIFDTKLNVIAYELLFRSATNNKAIFTDGDKASSHVLLYAFGQHRIEDILGNVPAFINFTNQLLVYPPPLPPDKLVIEILEDVKPDRQVLEGIQSLKERGYKIALDDFVINKDTRSLLKYANIIKIDVMALPKKTIQKYVLHLRPLKLTLLAEKIETQEMFEYCKELEFDLFQGYFLQKPNIIEGVKLSESKHSILRLLMTLTNSDVSMDSVVNAVASDPRLSFRILKIVNSTSLGIPCKIHSLNQAVTMLGLTQIRNWATFLILSGDTNKPAELSLIGTTRAKFCELIGTQLKGRKFGETCFTAGLMSTFDAFLDIPLAILLEQLGISEEIESALLTNKGDIGEILAFVKAVESADWATIEKSKYGILSNLEDKDLNEYYSDSLVWAQEITKELS